MKRLSEAVRGTFESLLFLTYITLFTILSPFSANAFSDTEVARFQSETRDNRPGERIALWAERFVGSPYDTDPLGEYVTKSAIVADERVDCMYLTFRAVELALSSSPQEAVQTALDKRFHKKGVMNNGKVANYEDRFEYGEDMIYSGKWGREITAEVGRVSRVRGTRGREYVAYLSSRELAFALPKLRSGDIIFFIKSPGKRKIREVVGHIGIIKTENGTETTDNGSLGAERKKDVAGRTTDPDIVYVIHAGGIKGKGGMVKKVLLKDYILRMPFIGAKITRFD